MSTKIEKHEELCIRVPLAEFLETFGVPDPEEWLDRNQMTSVTVVVHRKAKS